MSAKIAVTGVTGAVGGMVASELAGDGYELRMLARTPQKVAPLPGATVVPASYADRDTATAALQGIETLFMVSAAENADRLAEHRAFIDSALAAGVHHVIYTSFTGAAPDATFTLARDHYVTEQYLIESGLAYTFLRDNLYSDQMGAKVGDDGVIRGPAADGRAAMVARADVARSASAIIREPGPHNGATYELSGPEAFTLAEAAAILTDARGSLVTFYNETVPEAYASREKYHVPEWMVDAWVSTYTAIAAGELALVSPDVERLTGRAPLSLAEVVALAG